MNAVDEIQAAIGKLTQLRDSANDAHWLAMDSDVVLGDPNDPVEAYPLIAECNCDADAELIVTLHRTINAQLAILSMARLRLRTVFRKWDVAYPDTITNALTLARAIIGGA